MNCMKIMKLPEMLFVSLLCAGSVSGPSLPVVAERTASGILFPVVRTEEYISLVPDHVPTQIAAGNGQQPTDNTGGAVPVQEDITHSTDKGKSDTDPTGLTPSGNMSLVDDLNAQESRNTEFLTVTTKNNNIFYIVIEKDKTTQNVHFLNQVDERDLMNLMSEEDLKEIQQEPKETALPITIQTPEPTAKEPAEPAKGISVPAVVAGALGAVGIGTGLGYYLFKIRPEKRQRYLDESIEFEDEEDYINEDEDSEYEDK